MPKYTPTDEDMYSTKACVVCGEDVIEYDTETCCELCAMEWEHFKDDYEFFFMEP